MKKTFLISLCIIGLVLPALSQKQDLEDAITPYEKGNATSGEEYFFGVQEDVVEIDVKLRLIDYLDSIDAEPQVFAAHLDGMLAMIHNCKKAMIKYEGKGWPKQNQLRALTVEWVDAVKMLINEYLKPWSVPMSIPDQDWKDADFKLYDKYVLAYDAYLKIDSRWVDFQYEFAAANNFELSDETIDMDALMEEDIKK